MRRAASVAAVLAVALAAGCMETDELEAEPPAFGEGDLPHTGNATAVGPFIVEYLREENYTFGPEVEAVQLVMTLENVGAIAGTWTVRLKGPDTEIPDIATASGELAPGASTVVKMELLEDTENPDAPWTVTLLVNTEMPLQVQGSLYPRDTAVQE